MRKPYAGTMYCLSLWSDLSTYFNSCENYFLFFITVTVMVLVLGRITICVVSTFLYSIFVILNVYDLGSEQYLCACMFSVHRLIGGLIGSSGTTTGT